MKNETCFSSTIVPTIGRESLSRTVLSVLEQESFDHNFELVIVNDSGQPLPEAEWMCSEQVRLIDTNRRNRSVARNAGAAVARGRYLHFLDDDDWLLPGAFRYLKQAAIDSSAAWIYGGFHLVNRQGEMLKVFRPDEQGNCAIRFAVGEWLPLQASFIRADAFFAVGGFASLESLLGGDEDVDLSRQISLQYEITGTTHPVVVIQFGHESSTTNYAQLQQQSRISREKMLSSPGAAKRLLNSARSRPINASYWHGRLFWCYWTSVFWNLVHHRPLKAVSRLLYSILVLALSVRNLLFLSFWQGAAGRPFPPGWLKTGWTN